jgi:hypothetical protein
MDSSVRYVPYFVFSFVFKREVSRFLSILGVVDTGERVFSLGWVSVNHR